MIFKAVTIVKIRQNSLARCPNYGLHPGKFGSLLNVPFYPLTWGIGRSLVELKEYDEALPCLKRIKAAGGRGASSIDALTECEAGK